MLIGRINCVQVDRRKMWLKLDLIRRKAFIKNEFRGKFLKSFKCNTLLSYGRRYHAVYFLSTGSTQSSVVRLRNRCLVSGRVWGLDRKTGYARFVFRSELYKSNLPGFSRASW